MTGSNCTVHKSCEGGAGVKFVDLRISSMMAEETQPFILVSVGFTKLGRRKTKVILNGSMNIEHETKQTPISLEKLIFN